ncbi:MAG: YHYH protein [Calditrichaeota bacterium]|nr:YHYH protein [Calditrichota bacterium]
MIKSLFFIVLISFFGIACSNSSQTENSSGIDLTDLPAAFAKFTNVTDLYLDGNMIVIKTKDLPNHVSPYYQNTQWAAEYYQSYNGNNQNFILNPNRISEQNLTFRIPLNPAVASNHSPTPLGPIGVSVNGVAIYNQYAAPGDDLAQEINTFDQKNGHPQQQGQYHYHIEPYYLSETNGKDALVGFLLDGFPVYGPMENGNPVSNNDLDVYHGHSHATADYPDAIYHYHITDAAPYINGDGFYGTAGTVSN